MKFLNKSVAVHFANQYALKMSQHPAKRARKELSLDTKIKLIKDADQPPHPTQKELAEKYEIGRQTVADILKKKTVLQQQYEENANGNKKRFNNKCRYKSINDLLIRWFRQARSKNTDFTSNPESEGASLLTSAEYNRLQSVRWLAIIMEGQIFNQSI